MPSPKTFERGDVVVIADRHAELAGKPRPAVVLQSRRFETSTLTVLLITSIAIAAPLLRIALPADRASGLQLPSWVAIDQLTTVRRSRISRRIGRLGAAKMVEINQAVLVFLGIADSS